MQKILQVLNDAHLLTSENLDIRWATTEAEGTFDVVKSNVCGACNFEHLCNKIFAV